ncbi:uncharacterized protein LOC118439352 [Folsomia candida]|uniref:Uncharacterized protein n=1 Tax=Folsomia candida TaxID=158441 RepID=A0A226D809_FOLCA|nr:uncharacterized protein LOC118439352 [Folsomia candida]OXA40396.1 hypothetical protein Fcan01_25076 [Folsomia candida]
MDFSRFELILISIISTNIGGDQYSTRSGHTAIVDFIRSAVGGVHTSHINESITDYLCSTDNYSSNNTKNYRQTAFDITSLDLESANTTKISAQTLSRCVSYERDCSFYSRCLEKAIPCGAQGYATGYGEKYCIIFTKNVSKFTRKGQIWIWSTMSCLQRALEPIANRDVSMNCSKIAEVAHRSHPICYVVSTPGGVCLLPFADWAELFRIVKIDTFALKQLAIITKFCGNVYYGQILAAMKTLYGQLGFIV